MGRPGAAAGGVSSGPVGVRGVGPGETGRPRSRFHTLGPGRVRGAEKPPRGGFLRAPLPPFPRRGGRPPGARGRGAGVAAPGAGSGSPCPPRPSCRLSGPAGPGAGTGSADEREKRSARSVLQDRGDHTARGVGGERAEWASEDGRRHRGFLGRRRLVPSRPFPSRPAGPPATRGTFQSEGDVMRSFCCL